MLPLVSLFLLITPQLEHTFASYCGEDAIPFSLQTLSNGQPVLGCARPSCFGWGDKTDKGSSARFYRIHKKNDGFMRKNDLRKYDKVKIAARESQLAFCEKNYASLACDENTQWVGGISPSVDVTSQPLFLQCCTFGNLKDSWDRGIADVAPGQIVIGGEVMHDERQYAFDYIANVKKYTKEDGSLAYSVTIRRFRCVPHPATSNITVEASDRSFIINRMLMNRTISTPKMEQQQPQTAISVAFAHHLDDQPNNYFLSRLPSVTIEMNSETSLREQTLSQGPTGTSSPQLIQPPSGGIASSVTSSGLLPLDNANFSNPFPQVSPDNSAVYPALPLFPGLSILPLNGTPSPAALAVTSVQQQLIPPPSFGTNQQPGVVSSVPGQSGFTGQQAIQQPLILQQQQPPGLQPLPFLMQSPSQVLQPQQQSLQPRQQSLQLPQLSQHTLLPSASTQPQQQPSVPSQQPLQQPGQFSKEATPPGHQQSQVQQPLGPQSSQFPTFPSLNQLLGLPMLPALPSQPNTFG